MSQADKEIEYYAVVCDDRTRDNPGGLVRRRLVEPGPIDEALQRDLSWRWTPGLMRSEQGEIGTDFVEISEDEAMRLIERFRTKWSAEDSASV